MLQTLLLEIEVETKSVLRKLASAHKDLHISRSTAIRYLEALVTEGILVKHKFGRDNFYLNSSLFALLSGS